jgi:hypothetical protein
MSRLSDLARKCDVELQQFIDDIRGAMYLEPLYNGAANKNSKRFKSSSKRAKNAWNTRKRNAAEYKRIMNSE